MPSQKPNIQASTPVSGQNQIRKQQLNLSIASHPPSQSLPPPNPQPQSMPSHPIQQTLPTKGHISAQSAPMSLPQPSQVPGLAPLPQHTAPQPPPLHQLPIPSLSTQSQQPLPNSSSQYMPHQPPLPQQPRPPMSMPGFPHQAQPQMGPNSGFQHPSGPQMHHSQHMFHVSLNLSEGTLNDFLIFFSFCFWNSWNSVSARFKASYWYGAFISTGTVATSKSTVAAISLSGMVCIMPYIRLQESFHVDYEYMSKYVGFCCSLLYIHEPTTMIRSIGRYEVLQLSDIYFHV